MTTTRRGNEAVETAAGIAFGREGDWTPDDFLPVDAAGTVLAAGTMLDERCVGAIADVPRAATVLWCLGFFVVLWVLAWAATPDRADATAEPECASECVQPTAAIAITAKTLPRRRSSWARRRSEPDLVGLRRGPRGRKLIRGCGRRWSPSTADGSSVGNSWEEPARVSLLRRALDMLLLQFGDDGRESREELAGPLCSSNNERTIRAPVRRIARFFARLGAIGVSSTSPRRLESPLIRHRSKRAHLEATA